MRSTRPFHAFIHGSCVSRDLVATSSGRLTTQTYVARQSWISATSPASAIPDGQRLQSTFQIRNLEGDWKSSALRALRAHAGAADLVLFDLVDERDGVYEITPGRFVTNTAELRRSGWLPGRDARLVSFGTDEHFALWRAAAARVRDVASQVRVLDRTVLLGTPFADYCDDGVPVAPHASIPATIWNERYLRYFDYARELGFRVIELPAALSTSTQTHTWGPAPYHYVDDAYRWWEERIQLPRDA